MDNIQNYHISTDQAYDSTLAHINEYKINLTKSEDGFNAANVLIDKMYGWRGYTCDNKLKPTVTNLTLSAFKEQEIVGTVTLNMDSPSHGMFADALFKPEIDEFRSHGAKVCEFTKLAFDHDAGSKASLGAMFHVLFIYAKYVHGCTDAFIEVNPRHRRFYESLLGFRKISDLKTNLSVNAPAYLLWINLEEKQREISSVGGTYEQIGSSRSLYPYFFGEKEDIKLYGRIAFLG